MGLGGIQEVLARLLSRIISNSGAAEKSTGPPYPLCITGIRLSGGHRGYNRFPVVRYYEILQLRPGASPSQIQQAYRDLVRVWHPDRFAHDPRLQKIAEHKLKEINAAYIALEKTPPEPPLVQKPTFDRRMHPWQSPRSC